MATHAFTAHGADPRPGAVTPTSMTYRPMAGSPTLTNPDMILPDYDFPDSPHDRSESPLMMWNNTHIGDMQFHLPPSQNSFIAGPLTPSTPIIYGNGTMLSDIGEVTEVESVVGRGPRGLRRGSSHLSVPSDDDALLRSSPTMGLPQIKTKSQIASRERRSSIESTSTVTTQGRNAPFADFDDAVSVDDINFQGDDEESMASSYVEGTPTQEPGAARRTVRQVSGGDRFSTSSISDRAEQILANAKKRLTTMEGNLSRARSSLYYTPMSDGSTPSPPIVRPSTSLRDPTIPSSSGHSRMLSDSSFHNDMPGYPTRSASALGAAGGYRQPLTSSRSADALGSGDAGSGRRPQHHPLDISLEPLSEDEDLESPNSNYYSNLRSPTFGYVTDKEITRSVSVAQMRDLKGQMMDLKGKISSLKEQARADSMKRRSLQSLRTPSPFTHSRWDQGIIEKGGVKSPGLENGSWQAPASWNAGLAPADFGVEKTRPSYEEIAAAEAAAENDGVPGILYEPAAVNLAESEVINGAGSSQSEQTERGFVVKEEQEIKIEQKTEDTQDHKEKCVVKEECDVKAERDTKEEHDVKEEHDAQQQEVGMVEQVKEDEQLFEEATLRVAEDDWEENEKPAEAEQDEVVSVDEVTEEEQDGDYSDYESESGESLYHDTVQHAVSHEDREDAFDYEHFFLHSAMGTISQQRLGRRDSSSSFSSEDSVETTRGPVLDRQRKRRSSIDTMSSVNSFATATEGRSSRTSTLEDETKETAIETPDLSDCSDGPTTSKRTTFGGFEFPRTKHASGDFQQGHPRRTAVVHRPTHSENVTSHRPSISSFESTGTNRSFPLVNRSKINGGVLTPEGSPDLESKRPPVSIVRGVTGVYGKEASESEDEQTAAVRLLPKEDQVLVEKLVASLGRCVLGLTEVSKAGTEARMYRRRLETARRILEGLE
ncbi:hypothetical protein EDB81DRAFT_776804 [Dactylonectria macrodidyma]|uniref:Uncharacterized protein n=1 Tax=Dactylonectria macrodidyma TaxID=307937 RepID=A0A9P9FQN8_9HYPO|nr:hypothetical protein EDB81DRAFT_776804 [Dactylonectria macrodidyma]